MKRMHDIFAALADPTRLKILLLIRDIQLSMGELADILDQSQPRVSRHVRILAETGLVRRHKEGAWVFVGLGDNLPTEEIYSLIDRLLDGRDPCATERTRLLQVRSERQKAVDHWFDAHAAEWDLMRRLEGPVSGVEAEILAAARQPAVGRLLDIGTGTGRMLELLSAQADSAIGVDRSPEMLRLARAKIAGLNLPQTEVRQADMRALPFAAGSFDTVTLHHVLHFADDPAAVLAGAAALLAPGGKILIADYEAHLREELRTLYQHVRLGFDEDAVISWLKASGLTARTLYRQNGPELTVIIWEGRR
jgi:ArsR family transcriptional regulator